MNREKDNEGNRFLFDRIGELERRIRVLEDRLNKEKELMLEEDLKIRGLK